MGEVWNNASNQATKQTLDKRIQKARGVLKTVAGYVFSL
jgi:hypothetical protein